MQLLKILKIYELLWITLFKLSVTTINKWNAAVRIDANSETIKLEKQSIKISLKIWENFGLLSIRELKVFLFKRNIINYS
ncbi:hypothetical protein M0811_10229 [Anaeramoeba ignava]|uniref:Uncharacterized protein n=1 Tax=Anaeramoeba ignava TaxID=1746090 RepID=A0A9Q0LEV5_ANAIG|nr:hypothetical protein M0811_10229 [Anaeramoeba ignava]